MPLTSVYSLPYPSLSDPPHGPAQFQALAEAVEDELVRIDATAATNTSNIGLLQTTVAFPAFRLRRTTNQLINASTFTAIGFNAEDIDTHGGHDNATNNDRYTIQKTGIYVIQGGIGWVGNNVNTRITRLTHNGTAIPGSSQGLLATEATNSSVVGSRVVILSCNAGDILRVEGWQNSAGALNTEVTDYSQPSFVGHWLRA